MQFWAWEYFYWSVRVTRWTALLVHQPGRWHSLNHQWQELYCRVKHDSNGKVTLHALLSTSFTSLHGSVSMSLHLHHDGTLFNYCNFGHFNFVPTPMGKSLIPQCDIFWSNSFSPATTSLLASPHTPSKTEQGQWQKLTPFSRTQTSHCWSCLHTAWRWWYINMIYILDMVVGWPVSEP